MPGTFKHIYELQKFINGKPVGNIVKLQLTFNAVSIKVYYKTKEIWKKIFWPMMEPREEIEKVIINLSLMIDDGDNATDTYLSAPKTTQRYSISYVYLINDAETRKEGLFFKKQKMDLEQKEEDGKLYVKTYPTINSLKILQKLSNLPEYIIEYRDIKVYDDGVTKEVKY